MVILEHLFLVNVYHLRWIHPNFLGQKDTLNVEEDIVEKFFFKGIAGMQSNRYLILGLVNTFFHEKYEVSAEGNEYRGGTFFITKK